MNVEKKSFFWKILSYFCCCCSTVGYLFLAFVHLQLSFILGKISFPTIQTHTHTPIHTPAIEAQWCPYTYTVKKSDLPDCIFLSSSSSFVVIVRKGRLSYVKQQQQTITLVSSLMRHIRLSVHDLIGEVTHGKGKNNVNWKKET